MELLGYNSEDFIAKNFLPLLQKMCKDPIVSYIVTDESVAVKQLSIIYPTAEARKKDSSMPEQFLSLL